MRPSVEVRLSAIYLYPVKSCRGVALAEATVTPRGLAGDREWMVVHPDGRGVTQRELPRMALIEVALTREWLELGAAGRKGVRVRLAAEGRSRREVVVWGHRCPADDEGDAAAEWLSEFLGSPFRLVRFLPSHRRLSDQAWTGRREAENAFSDGFPFLVLSEESLADLNARVSGPGLPMDRFRPNLVISGGGAFAEDQFNALRWEGVEFGLVKPCTRCRITTTNQETAEVGVEPLRTLAAYRRNEALGGVVFGQNAILIAGPGRPLRVGMVGELRADNGH